MASSTDLPALVQAAHLYYEDNHTQEEIAATLGVSRPRVSRLLRQAREEGIVQITIHDPFATDEPLARQLSAAFGLSAAIVVPSGPGLTGRRLGHAGARLLGRTLRDGDTLGIGWGRTLDEVVTALPDHRRPVRVHVVPLVGGLGQVSPSYQVNELAQRLATAFGGTWQCLYAPAILESRGAAEAIAAQADVRRITGQWGQLNTALVGIGNTDFHSEVQVLFKDYLLPEIQERLLAAGAVGDICTRFFDSAGRSCPSGVPVLGIELEQLKRIGTVIAVAGGANKAEAILGALRGGYVRVLITDSAAAEGVMRLYGAAPEGAFAVRGSGE